MKGIFCRFNAALGAVALTMLLYLGLPALAQATGTVTVIAEFGDEQAKGEILSQTLSVAADGTLYGATEFGGANFLGVAFRISSSGTYTVLRHFSSADGGAPKSIALASDGYLYGFTKTSGDVSNFFRIGTDGSAFTILGTLPSNPSRLNEGEPGVFYGTSWFGGDSGYGSVFKVTSAGVVTQLYSFSGFDGGMPRGEVVRDSDGYLYGTTWYGGATHGDVNLNFGLGIGSVFKLAPDGTLTTLHSFLGPEGSYPKAGLTFDDAGNLYGVTTGGGNGGAGFGTIFKIDDTGQHTLLHTFGGYGGVGADPRDSLQYVQGYLYGADYSGGFNSTGNAYKIKIDGTGYEVVHDLIKASVSHPYRLWLGPENVFYGSGRDQGPGGGGTVFRLIDPWLPAKQVDLAVAGTAGQTDEGIVSATFEVINRVLGAALDVLVLTTVPAGATLLPEVSTEGCTLAGQLLTCDLGTVPGSSTTPVLVAFQLASPQPNLPLSVSVSALQPETAPADNTATLTTVRVSGTVDLSLRGAGSQTVAGLVSSSFTLSNAGEGIATGVLVTFEVPAGATLVTGSSSASCSQSGTTIRCLIGAMGPGATNTLQIVVQLPAMQQELLLDATASALQTDIVGDNNSALVDAGYATFDYKYDGVGHLSHRSVNGGPATHVFYTKGGLLLGEYGSGGELQRENIYLGKELVAYENAGASPDPSCPGSGGSHVSYVITDPLSSAVAGSNACGAVAWQQQYLPFGDRINHVAPGENDQWFAGDYQEGKTRLVNMGARQYNPLYGRFLSMDPAAVDPANSFSFNRYAYANNNPYRYVDPDGESPLEIAFLVADTVELVSAIRSGEGVGLAALNVAIDIIGVACPVPGVSGLSHAIQAANKTADVVQAVHRLDQVQDASKVGLTGHSGIVYKRTNPLTGDTYVGQAKSPERFDARKGEHNKDLGVDHDYEILGSAPAGKQLDVLEETMIRTRGGLRKEGGTLVNKRHQMSDKNYRKHGGTAPN